jgi:hypothetical protein
VYFVILFFEQYLEVFQSFLINSLSISNNARRHTTKMINTINILMVSLFLVNNLVMGMLRSVPGLASPGSLKPARIIIRTCS